jgi:hypothetical protein
MAKSTNADKKVFIIERAFRLCEYCKSPLDFSSSSFSIEHIFPLILGGTDDVFNLALSCQGCNRAKYIKIKGFDPVTNEIVPLFHPRNHDWKEHFTWSDDFLFMIGLSPIGRATVIELQLNRKSVLNLRFALLSIGQHPPKM